MTERRDWDKELADIDRLIEKMPARRPGEAAVPAGRTEGAPQPAGRPGAPPAAGAPHPVGRPPRGRVFGLWAVLLLVLALGGLLLFWPYRNACGTGLLGYLAAVAVVVLGALWTAVRTWRLHRPVAHLLAILALMWGLALAAERVLPRVGYAAESADWTCADPQPAPSVTP